MTNREFIKFLNDNDACSSGVEWYKNFSKRTKQGLQRNIERMRRDALRDTRRLPPDEFIPLATTNPHYGARTETRYFAWLMLTVVGDAFCRRSAATFEKTLIAWPAERIINAIED